MTSFPWKPRELFWQDLWILTLPQQTCYHGNRMSDFQKNSLFVEKFLALEDVEQARVGDLQPGEKKNSHEIVSCAPFKYHPYPSAPLNYNPQPSASLKNLLRPSNTIPTPLRPEITILALLGLKTPKTD